MNLNVSISDRSSRRCVFKKYIVLIPSPVWRGFIPPLRGGVYICPPLNVAVYCMECNAVMYVINAVLPTTVWGTWSPLGREAPLKPCEAFRQLLCFHLPFSSAGLALNYKRRAPKTHHCSQHVLYILYSHADTINRFFFFFSVKSHSITACRHHNQRQLQQNWRRKNTEAAGFHIRLI